MRTLQLFENSVYSKEADLEEAGYRNYDDNRTGFGRPSRDMSDEANMMYRYDTADGKLKQRMIANPQRQQAFDAGFKDTQEEALKAHNVIRSKFGANKYVQKQGAKWVQVYPYGQQGVAEGEEHSPVAGAITRRIMSQRLDLLKKYGPANVAAAIDDVAEFVGDVDEIGSSDVSGWVKQVEQSLGGVNETNKQGTPQSHQAKTTLKHLKKASYGDRADAANIKPGTSGYRDRIDMLQRAEKEGNLKVDEGTEFGANYAEQLAQKVFNVKPKLASEDDVLNIGHKVATQDLMSQVRANYLFARDQDFPSDFVSAYYYLQKQKPGVAEAEISQSRIGKMNTPNQEFYGKNPHFAKGAEVKNVGKTVDATGKPVSALATKVTPQFNKPALVKKLRATPFEEGADDLQQRLSTLESAMVKARNITKAIKYDGTVSDILVSIRQLAENAGIDARDLTYAENEVFDAKKQLESAIYGLDEIFQDAIQNLQYQIQDAEEN